LLLLLLSTLKEKAHALREIERCARVGAGSGMVTFMASPKAPIEPPAEPAPPAAWHWIKTDCGRAKYAELARRSGPVAWLRLAWFVLVAALRDWRLSAPEPENPS
jgi:hypothetical protein